MKGKGQPERNGERESPALDMTVWAMDGRNRNMSGEPRP
jgi:hypothetical protein